MNVKEKMRWRSGKWVKGRADDFYDCMFSCKVMYD